MFAAASSRAASRKSGARQFLYTKSQTENPAVNFP
jgi:hypothetical protein